jgi:hypothetical protein
MAASTPATAAARAPSASWPAGTVSATWSATALTIAQLKNRPMSRPRQVPNRAMITDSQRTIARTCRRAMPIARSRPSSRVRSKTDRASVLAMPSRAIRTARPSRT